MKMKVSGGLFLKVCGGLLVISSVLLFVQSEDEEWIDPYDMLNYDPASKSMRKPAESSSYSNVPTKRREYSQESCQVAQCPEVKECTDKVNMLQREIEEIRRRETFSSQQPTCNPVFKRFLAKLLKEIDKLGLPTAVTAEKHYDAEVKLSKKRVIEIQKLVSDESSWRTGALDDALSQILINFKHHDPETWKWRFEDTFGVEPDTVIKVSVIVLIIVVIICTEMWSLMSWFVQFKRMLAICFFISLVWNWFYLYKIAFAEHQANMVKMENVNGKCTGVKKFDWMDNIKEWYRTTLTLQEDPCKKYYEALIVNPILLVSPMKAITMTIATFFTDPLKHIGQGISEFLRALLKDLPFTLQIPVLLLIGLSVVVFIYSSSQAAVHHAFLRPLRGGRRDPPPNIAQQQAAPPIREQEEHGEEERYLLAGGDANRAAQPRHHIRQEGNEANRMGNRNSEEENRPEIRQRGPNRPTIQQQRVYVETLRNADRFYSGDEMDTQQEAVAEDLAQHVEEETLTLSNSPKEEHESSASNTEMKHTQPASKEHSAKSDTKDNKTSGNTERNAVGDSASIGKAASKKEDRVENIGTPVQETPVRDSASFRVDTARKEG
ncbi:chloride channel CLIC-like protein 1 isoform X2 [Ictalurus furcatus]|uniref:chloride channel CLIC-like protein 1 isoform X2 n=1 Tax=Ictalurus furcatus TaxID=66913 RepID=UPI002350823B|nr:chloride channel CLIC-like protein 1 isoform X2 [Ictalurus furcatus]